jgi:hypothetical protein
MARSGIVAVEVKLFDILNAGQLTEVCPLGY